MFPFVGGSGEVTFGCAPYLYSVVLRKILSPTCIYFITTLPHDSTSSRIYIMKVYQLQFIPFFCCWQNSTLSLLYPLSSVLSAFHWSWRYQVAPCLAKTPTPALAYRNLQFVRNLIFRTETTEVRVQQYSRDILRTWHGTSELEEYGTCDPIIGSNSPSQQPREQNNMWPVSIEKEHRFQLW